MSIAELRSPPFDVIRCNDPRLQVSLPAFVAFGSASVAQTAASADPVTRQVLADAADWLRRWVRATASAPLDDLADELIHAWERLRPTATFHPGWPDPAPRKGLAPPLRPAVHEAVARRLGLRGDPPPSLTACVSGTGIKIERLRQLTLQLRFVATARVWAPMLDRALDLGSDPVDRSDYAAALKAAGIARRPWYPEAVNALAELCGRERRIAAVPDLDVTRLAAKAARVINRDHLGVAALGDIAAAVAADQQRPVSPEHVSAALTDHGGGLATDRTWAWRTVAGRRTPALLRAAQGMLAVAGHLPVPTIHHGWCRRLRGRGVRAEPPVEAVEAVLRAEASFVVDDLPADRPAIVHLARPLRPEQVYRGAVTALIEAIRTAPGHVLTHRELQRIAATAGVGPHSVSHYLAYHEAFLHQGPDSWTVVGNHRTPASGSR
jgi:hypothetical protein